MSSEENRLCLAPAGNRFHDQNPISPSESTNGWIQSIRWIQPGASQNAAILLTRTAQYVEAVAKDQEKMVNLLHSLSRITDLRTRHAALEALGFDFDTATGLGLRIANRWDIFQDGRAVMHKRSPLSVDEVRVTLHQRALQLLALADKLGGRTLGESMQQRQRLHQLVREGLTQATVAWDLTSAIRAAPQAAGAAGSLILAVGAETENELRWEYCKLLALTPAMTVADLENARAAYTKGYALVRISAILSPIPFSGTGVSLLGALTGESTAARPSQLSLYQLIEAAGRLNAAAEKPAAATF